MFGRGGHGVRGLRLVRQKTGHGGGREGHGELGIEKERKGILKRWFCSWGKKSCRDWRK